MSKPTLDDPVALRLSRPDVLKLGAASGHASRWHDFFSLPLGSSNPDRGLLVLNHEYLDQRLLFPDAMKTWNAEKLGKAKNAMGVSVIEVKREGTQRRIVRP